MGIHGYRDGIFNARAFKSLQKRYKEDLIYGPIASTVLIASAACSATTSIQPGTTLAHPRNIVAVNKMEADAERKVTLDIKGYDAQGAYRVEKLQLSSADDGTSKGNIAFAHITEIVPATETKGFGTYSSVSFRPGTKFGLSEYCENYNDLLGVAVFNGGADAYSLNTAITSSATLFNSTYQTLDINAIAYTGSVVGIRYRSQFQKRH